MTLAAGSPSGPAARGGGRHRRPAPDVEETVANSFLDYLAKLVDETAEEATRLYGDATPEAVARKLCGYLDVPEPVMDEFSHGYPIWRLALPGRSEWCWCSPNRVPAGFQRDGATVIATHETALRLPEDPDCVVLLSCTKDSKATVSGALTALKLATR
jgi:hypothetical protein